MKLTKKGAEKKALKAMSDYIRARDKYRCFTCGKIGDNKNIDAGHLFSRRYTAIKFDEINVHSQCVYCNQYLSGNLHEYIKRFIAKYGQKAYNDLDNKKNILVKRNINDFLQIEKYYKDQLCLL